MIVKFELPELENSEKVEVEIEVSNGKISIDIDQFNFDLLYFEDIETIYKKMLDFQTEL